LAPFAPPEIVSGDLTGLALELALWGTGADGLAFLTPPAPTALAEARALLTGLGALDGTGRITTHGRRMAALPLHPRLAHMLLVAGPEASTLAALLEERDPVRGATADLTLRLDALLDPAGFERRHPLTVHRGTVERIRTEAKRLSRMVEAGSLGCSTAEMAALAYPDRIGLRRDGEAARFVLSGGKGAVIDLADPLSRARLVVATDLDGDPLEARIRQGIALTDAEMRRLFSDRITREEVVEWSRRDGRVLARMQERLGALVLSDAPLPRPSPEAVARAAVEGLRAIGLPMTDAAWRLRARLALLRGQGADLQDVSDEGLLAETDWLLPAVAGKRTEAELRALDLTEALKSRLTWEQQQQLDRLAPASFETPLGRRIPIDYGGEHPSIEVRLQELFGVTVHPTVGPKRLPLRVTLLSPAQRPIQVTMDLPGFWRTSYADVRKDMRGQYPRHPWPEDPTEAEPTLRAKPRTH
jgi:ATP-dependent helicase HrpB